MKKCPLLLAVFLISASLFAGDTVLVGTFFNGNNDFLNSRAYIWNPSDADADLTARVYTLPRSGPSTLLGTISLGLLNARSGRNIKIAEDILFALGILLPYTADGGNLMVEFTVGADNVRGTGQVFASDLAFGTYPLEVMPGSSVSPTQGPDPPPPSGTFLLALLSSTDNLSAGGFFVTVEGQVKNISNEPLESVLVVITWFTQDDDFITFDDSFIGLNPILSGETAPFSTFTVADPAMSKFTVSFKEFVGGSIPFEDRR